MSKFDPIKNKWIYHPKDRCLRFYGQDGKEWYEVPMDECADSAEVLDWIVQVHSKTWATSEVFHAFVEGLNDLLRFQENYCSHGESRKVVRELLERMEVGWRIYPRPNYEAKQRERELPVITVKEMVAADTKWHRECERICREIFEAGNA